MLGTLATIALATATLVCSSGCVLPASCSLEERFVDVGHLWWFRDQVPDGTLVDEAIKRLEEAGLRCEVEDSKLRCYSRETRWLSSEEPKALFEFEIEDGKVFDRSVSPHMKQYRTHGGVI